MPRIISSLADAKCEAAKPKEKDYTLFDGQGLYLLIKPSGTKVWRLKIQRPCKKQGLMTLGRYPALTLKQAELLAQDWHKAQIKRGKWSPNHAERIWRDLELNLLPALSL